MKRFWNCDCNLASVTTRMTCAFAFISVDGLDVFSIDVDDEERQRYQKKGDSNNEGSDKYTFEGLEREPCFVAEGLQAAFRLVILHLNRLIKLS